MSPEKTIFYSLRLWPQILRDFFWKLRLRRVAVGVLFVLEYRGFLARFLYRDGKMMYNGAY